MGCCGGGLPIDDSARFGVVQDTPCTAITVDMLSIYKKNVDCYVMHKLWNNIGSTEAEMQAAQTYLQTMISQKIADPNDCTNIESLYLVRLLVHKIILGGVCL